MSRPWMPLYVADYRHDTAHLSAAEHGAYLLLIMHYWTAGRLPDDDRQLARIASMTAAEWRRARPVVQALFHDGWRHKRIDAELARAADISSKRAASAKQRHSNSSANAPANAEQLHTHARASSQPQTHSEEGTSPSSEARKRATRLPANWMPSPEGIAFARSRGLTDVEINWELEKFANHWTAKSGRDATKVDWEATWRNWVLNAIERKGTGHGRTAKPTASDRARDLAEQIRQQELEAGIGRPAAPVGGC